MAETPRSYFCIDMKSFYASVECAERGLNPFETNLVVADSSRGTNAICLAISPKMKALGIKNRCRLNDIPRNLPYLIAKPRMQLYIEYSADIYGLYLDYFAPQDIHVYSIDESFIDATSYLKTYHLDERTLAKKLLNAIANKLHIPATAGIGTNLYLAKIALDITAKHTKDHLGYLTEKIYQETLWDHMPITDFWQVASGKASRLARYCILTMRGITEAREELMYKLFGKDAELLIDHAWGRESCLISDIKSYTSKSHSVSFSQILPRDYTFEEAEVVMEEMLQHGCLELIKRKVITQKLWIGIGYSREIQPATHGTIKLPTAINVSSLMRPQLHQLFQETALHHTPIRRLGICFADVCDEACEGYDLFTDWQAVSKEKNLERAVLNITEKYGKNSVLRGLNLLTGATQKERNEMIGGHRAGYADTPRKS